jgi:hypothetical protein
LKAVCNPLTQPLPRAGERSVRGNRNKGMGDSI